MDMHLYLFQGAFSTESCCKKTLLTNLFLSRHVQSNLSKKYLRPSAAKTAKSQQLTAELLDNMRTLWTIDDRDRTVAKW